MSYADEMQLRWLVTLGSECERKMLAHGCAYMYARLSLFASFYASLRVLEASSRVCYWGLYAKY